MSEAIKLVSVYLESISEMLSGVYVNRNSEIVKIREEFLNGLDETVFDDKKKLQKDMINVGKDFKKAINSHLLIEHNG